MRASVNVPSKFFGSTGSRTADHETDRSPRDLVALFPHELMLITDGGHCRGRRQESALPGIITTLPDAEDSPARSVNAIVSASASLRWCTHRCHSPTSGFRSKSLEDISVSGGEPEAQPSLKNNPARAEQR